MIEIATDCELIGQVTTQGKILGTMIGQSGPPGPAGPKGDTGNVKFENLTTEQKKELRGENGYTPQKGIDYFTESEVEEIKANLLAETNGNIQKIEEKLHEKDETLNTENKLIKEQIPSANVSGDSLHIEDSGSLDFDWKIRGGYKQQLRKGYNFLKVEKETTTINGITFTINQNGSVTCNGISTSKTTFYFASTNNSIYPKQIIAGKYKLVGGTASVMLGCQIGSVYYNTNSVRTIELTEQSSISNAYIQIASGKTVNNETIYPLLYEYNNTDKPYEQYGASPSPDYPSEVETVGNNINFINMDNLEEQITDGLKYSIKDGVLTIKGTATANKTLIFNSKTQVNLKANTYTLNVNKSGSLAGVFGYYIYGTLTPSGDRKVLIDGGNLASSTNTGIKTQALTENNYYNCSFAIYFSKNCTTDMTLTPKLEEGSVATPYSPYNQGSVEIDVVNKNLFDKNTMIELTNAYREYGNSGNIAQLNGFNGLKIPVKSGHKYILSTDATIYNNLCFFDKNMTFLGGYSYNTSFTAPNNCQYVTYAIVNNYTYIQFEEGTTSSDYVEHEQQTAIMPIQQEMLDGDYVADVEHHEWGKLVLTGNENFAQGQNANKLNYFYLGSNSVKLRGKTISNMLKSVENGIIWNKTSYDDIVSSSSNSKTINIMLSDTTITTLQQFKEKLKELYNAGTPVIFYFELAEPLNLELIEEQKAIRENKLYTYKNITNISLSDELANIDVEYRKNLKVNNFTDEDRSKLIPPGGAVGQVLAKNTDTDNDVKWVDQAGGTTGDTLPIGSIMPYPKAVAPENWLICDGSAVSRTDYSELFNVIGTFFGAGDGKTTFNLPNIKGKTIVGLDNSDTDFNAIGKVLGEKTHTLTVDEMPSHNHSMGSFNQYNDGTGGTFAESEKVGRTTSGADGSKGINPIFNTGGSKEHNNIQPSFVGCYIIKAKQSAGVVATVIDNLTSASTIDALSAKQGKILNEKINGTVLYEDATGTNGTVTFNEQLEDGDWLEIIYCRRRTNGTYVYKSTGKLPYSLKMEIALDIVYYAQPSIQQSTSKLITVNQQTITNIRETTFTSNTSTTEETSVMYIMKVIKYKA